jgi:6,7-dimethyl-8-ribityllumazine synthase
MRDSFFHVKKSFPMATAYHNLSEYSLTSVPNAEQMKFGIVVSEWNDRITGKLLQGAVETLKKHGAKPENILIKAVPGSFELTYGANRMLENCELDAVIVLGCVIKGDTPHFDYVCMGVTQGIAQLNATGDIPVIYGLITTLTMEQAEDRSGGKLGNKGDECAVTAIKMIDLAWSLNK